MNLAVELPPPSVGLPPPPSIEDWFPGDWSGWALLSRAANDIEAQLLAGRLAHAGIESYPVKDRFAPGAWLYGNVNPWAPVDVYVRKLQLDDARIVLAEIALEC